MTMSTPGKIARILPHDMQLHPAQPGVPQLRDLSDPRVRDQIVSKARKDANATLLRTRRAATCS